MSYKNQLAWLIVAVLLVAMPQFAFAAGTFSGTTIENSATLDYQVGTVQQAQLFSDTAAFLVDNKVDITVATVDGAAITVIPGDTAQYLTFTVTNFGNTVQDFSLSAVPAVGALFGVTDNIDLTNVRVFVDANGNGVYDTGVDNATYIDELAQDAVATVFIVSDVQLTALDLDGALYDLVAQVADGGTAGSQGADITNDDNGHVSPGGTPNNIVDDPTVVEIVFADGAGSLDAIFDGRHSSQSVYVVGSALLAVTKVSVVANDPFNGVANPKAIPGATVTYTLDVANSGTAPAANVVLVDQIPTNTTFASASVGTVNSNGAAIVTVEYSTDGVTWAAAETAPVAYVRVTFSVVDANDGVSDGTAQLSFNVTIN